MSTRVTIKMKPRFSEILEREISVRALERERAEQAADIARSTAPVGATGNYKASIDVEEDVDGVALVANDFKAHWIEFGTVRMRAFRTLTNAADEVARVRSE